MLLLFFVVLIGTNMFLKNKVESFTNKSLPKNISATYDDLSLHLLDGTLTYTNVSVALKNKSNDSVHTYVSAAQVIVEDLSYWDYLFNKQIHIEDIKLKSPSITYHKDKLITSSDTSQHKAFIALGKPLLVDELSIDNANILFFASSQEDTLLHVPNITVEIDDILVDNNTLKKRMPVKFGDYQAKADSIFLKVGSFETLAIEKFVLNDNNARVNNIRLATKYNKHTYDRKLQRERDHFNVFLQKLDINQIKFGFKNRKFFATSPKIELDSIDATIYRNKLIADDPTIKPLYSKMLRELPIDITIDTVAIKNSALTYQEKVKQEQPPGTIYFDNFNATINNLSNTYPKGTKTTISSQSRFMKAAPLQTDWAFDVNSLQDNFTFKAELGVLPASNMNTFTKPNLLIELEGETDKTYFSIYGNHSQSTIDMRIDYKSFKVNLLRENGRKKDKLLSGLINLFVKKDSGSTSGKFNEGKATVTPDRTKSFFNYLWLNISAGLKKCLL